MRHIADRALDFETDFWFRYLLCMHWALAQFGVGSTDLYPSTIPELTFSIIVLFISLFMFSSLVSSMASTVTQLQSAKAEEIALFSVFRRFCTQHKICANLRTRILRYVEYKYSLRHRHLAMVDVKIFAHLSQPLLLELKQQMWMPHLLAHPFVSRLSLAFTTVVQLLCSMAVDNLPLASKDTLFRPGEVTERMYFVMDGELKYCSASGSKEWLWQGMWCCEATLWTLWVTLGEMQATVVSELMTVSTEQFSRVISLHPFAFDYVRRYASKFMDWLNLLDPSQTSDVIGGPLCDNDWITQMSSQDEEHLLHEPTRWSCPQWCTSVFQGFSSYNIRASWWRSGASWRSSSWRSSGVSWRSSFASFRSSSAADKFDALTPVSTRPS